MTIGVLSDVHGNLEALEAVLSDAGRFGTERWICLGDVVGYGADADACVARVRALPGLVAVRGNHDAAVVDDALTRAMSAPALAGVRHARSRLGADALAWLASRPLEWRNHPVLMAVHASPHEPERWEYVIDASAAARALGALPPQRVALVGHTHVPSVFADDGTARRARRDEVLELDVVRRRYVVGVGSVGQPRDGDADAAYGLVQDDPWRVTFRRVPYDRERAARRIREAGLPPVLAERLHAGR